MNNRKKYSILQTAAALAVTAAILLCCMYLPAVLAEASGERRIAQLIPLDREPLDLKSGQLQYNYSQRIQVLTAGPVYFTQMDFDAMTRRYYSYSNLYLKFLSELWSLVKRGLLTSDLYYTFTEVGIDQTYYYVCDYLNDSGFFLAELTARLSDGDIRLIMDLDSGRLIYLSCSGPRFCSEQLIPGEFLTNPDTRTSLVVEYAQYLELFAAEFLEETEAYVCERCETDSGESVNIVLQYEPPSLDTVGTITLSLSDIILP